MQYPKNSKFYISKSDIGVNLPTRNIIANNMVPLNTIVESILGHALGSAIDALDPIDPQSLNGSEEFPINTPNGPYAMSLWTFAQLVGGGGGGGGVPSHSLAEHNNVVGNPQNGDVLTFDNGNWVPAASGENANAWDLEGNENIDPLTQFIGGTGGPIIFKLEDVNIGRLGTGSSISFGVNSNAPNQGFGNTAYGANSLQKNIGSQNTAIGNSALQTNDTGSDNTAIGVSSLSSNTIGTTNTAIGVLSLYSNTIGSNNTSIGVGANRFNTEGNNNVAVGNNSLYGNTTGSQNIAIGTYAMQNMMNQNTGDDNICIGIQILNYNSTGYSNVAIGKMPLNKNTEGYQNVGIGYRPLFSNTTGTANIALGLDSLFLNTEGHSNISLGSQSALNNSTGDNNIAIGQSSLYNNTEGNANIAIGYSAINNATTGGYNVNLGNFTTLANATDTNSIIIGNSVTGLGSDTMVLGSNTTSLSRIKGAVAIGTDTPHPSAQLQIDYEGGARGFLPPRMSGGFAEGISSPAEGLLVYATTAGTGDITSKGWWGFDGTNWVKLN